MIRPLTATDVHSFIELRQKSLLTEPFAFGADPNVKIDIDQTRRDLLAKSDEDFVLGYFDGEKLGGMIGFIRYSGSKRKHKGWIWGMYVEDEYRKKGVGKRLLETTLAMARDMEGLKKVTLTASSNAIAAIRLYNRYGFSEFGRETEAMIWDDKSIDEIFYELFI